MCKGKNEMGIINWFFTDFNYLKGLVVVAAILVVIVFLLFIDDLHRKKMAEKYFD